MQTALGYIRISKDDPDSVSLEYQQVGIERYCIQNRLDLMDIECDRGLSGKSIQGRPAVKRVLQAVDRQDVEAVVVFKSDRISRNGIESWQIEQLFRDRGVAYLSVTEGALRGQSAEDEFMQYIRAGLNHRERRIISFRTKVALRRKKEKGERLGRPPFGWRIENKQPGPVEAEQAVIARVLALKTFGYSTYETVTKLQTEGFTSRSGGNYNQTQVCRILKQHQAQPLR